MSKRILSLVLSLSLLIAVTVGGWTIPASAAEETKAITNYAQYDLSVQGGNATEPRYWSKGMRYDGHSSSLADPNMEYDSSEQGFKFKKQNSYLGMVVLNEDESRVPLSEESITVSVEYKFPQSDSSTRRRICVTINNKNFILCETGGTEGLNGAGDDLVRGEWAVYSFVVTGDDAKSVANGERVQVTFWDNSDGKTESENDFVWIKSVTFCSTEDVTKGFNEAGADEYVSFNATHPLFPEYKNSNFVATNNMTWTLNGGEGKGTLTNDGMASDMIYFRPTVSLNKENIALHFVFKEGTTGKMRITYNDNTYNASSGSPEPDESKWHYTDMAEITNDEMWYDLSDADFRNSQNGCGSFRLHCEVGMTLQRVEVYVLNKDSGYTATLKEDISLNFHVGSPLFTKNAAKTDVSVTVNNNTTKMNLSDCTTAGEQYVVPVSVAAKNMGDLITVTVKNTENNVDMSFTKSVAEYAKDMLKDTAYAKAHDVVKAMLNYGAAAQTYFKYNDTDLVNADYKTDLSSVTPESLIDYNEYNKSKTVGTVTFIGANLSLKSKTTLRLYFTANASFTASVNGQSLTVMQEEATNRYYVEVSDITPDKLANDITVMVNDTGEVTYNVMSYCYNVLKLDDEKYGDLQDAIRALCLYQTAAADYVA